MGRWGEGSWPALAEVKCLWQLPSSPAWAAQNPSAMVEEVWSLQAFWK
jgi:hypothetical protein